MPRAPVLTSRDTVNASPVPARKTKVGAQRWVIQRVRNWTAGSGAPACHMRAASVNRRPPLNASELWSMAISTITRPRIQSSAASREAARASAGFATPLAWRPGELAAGQDVQVDVVDALAGVGAGVHG